MGTNKASLVMYFILRSDLLSDFNWPLGAVFTQIAHSATQCIWTFKDDTDVQRYMGEIASMHKVTLMVPNEASLKAEAEKLYDAEIQHTTWIEDNMPVCIAIKPQSKEKLKTFLRHLPLYK